jgi:PAS domain-containing protein
MKKVRFLFPVVLALAIAGVIASAMMVHILTIMLVQELTEGTWRIKTLLFGAAIAFLAFLLSLMFLLFRNRIQKPLSALVEYAQRFAGAGDGTARAKGRGTKGQELEKAAEFADSNPNLILTVTRDGRIVYANRSVERMLLQLGLPAQHFEILLPDETEEIVEAILSGEEKDRRVVCKTMGRTIDYTAIRLEESEAVGFYGTDLTEEIGERENEKALRRAGRKTF